MSHLPNPNRYQNMPYRRCGHSGVMLPTLSLGLYQNFTDNDSYANCQAVVCRAFDHGITHIDLANNYGSPAGSAERIFGRILNSELATHRDELLVSTKAGYDMWPGPYGEWGSRKYLLASLDQSLKRLGLDYVDVFYSHRFDPQTPLEETMGALDSAVRQGKALYAAISNYDAAQTAEAVAILRRLGTPCLVNQMSYSLLNRRIEERHLALHEKEGLGTIIFQPLQRGLLSQNYLRELTPERHAKLKAWGTPAAWLAKLPLLNEVASSRRQSLAQMAIAWSLQSGKVSSALIGASSVAQLDDCVGSLSRMDFSPEELLRIDQILA